jgi:tetratricopeptide (TPR) repeat protein
VVIYSGHNEYYGSLGSASTIRLSGSPALVRFVLRLKRLRSVQLLQNCLDGIRSHLDHRPDASTSSSRMEELAARDTLRLGSPAYRAGANQFESNLGAILGSLRHAGVPTYVAAIASNLRDRPPFASDTGGLRTNAAVAFRAASAALDSNPRRAESLFVRARDLDLIRFRAPSEFNEIIRRTADRNGAVYVPAAELISAESSDGIPGKDMFFEHVHPRPPGATLIARAFYQAVAADDFLGHNADTTRLRTWESYASRMDLTRLDYRVADLILGVLENRWPFVPPSKSSDFLSGVVARDLVDTLALEVVRGKSWVAAKVALGERFESSGNYDAAVAEYSGLIRDQPWNESAYRFAARALLAAGHDSAARPLLQTAYRIEPTAFTCFALARFAAADKASLPRAAALLLQAISLGGPNPAALYQLSLVYGKLGDISRARATALNLYRISPRYPGLAGWLRVLRLDSLK